MTAAYVNGKRGLLVLVLALAATFPLLVTLPYYQLIAILVLLYIALAVAFDLVVGRVGALSLAQPVFLGIGAYTAGIMSQSGGSNYLSEVAVAVSLSAAVAVAIGVPAFRLSTHAFGIATLAVAVCGGLVAKNWIGVTGGPMCTTGVPPVHLAIPGASVEVIGYERLYYLALAIAAISVGVVAWLVRSRVGLTMTAVRDDDLLASARGVWPVQMRIFAFAVSAALTAVVGTFMAHQQTVVCPNILDITYTIELLIIVFIGGRGSLRGVILAAVIFTALPQYLRIVEEWRLVLYGGLLVLIVVKFPDGIEHLLRRIDRWAIRRDQQRPQQPNPKQEVRL